MIARTAGRTPWHGRLAVRLFAATMVVAGGAVAATAWLTARTATSALQQQRGDVLADDSRIYAGLLDYAATHGSWTGVAPVVQSLARTTHRRIVLVASGQRVDTSATPAPVPAQQFATVDALNVDPSLAGYTTSDHVARQLVGPFKLTAADRRALLRHAHDVARCARRFGSPARIAVTPSGRPYVDTHGQDVPRCTSATLVRPTAAEKRGAGMLEGAFLRCAGAAALQYKVEFTAATTAPPSLLLVGEGGVWPVDGALPQPVGSCLQQARRQQLAPYAASPAQLFVTDAGGHRLDTARLPGIPTSRIVLAGSVILLLAALAAALAAYQLSRSVRQVTAAADRMHAGDAAVRVPRRRRRFGRPGEMDDLARAFNDMAAAVERGEQQRRSMIADVSHELRNPLTNLKGWVEAVEDGVVAPDREVVGVLAAQTAQLERLVDDLRDLALADADQLQLRTGEVVVGDLVEQVAAAFAVQAADGGVTLRTHVLAPVTFPGDPARLGQALGNLVGNAIRYTPPGGCVDVVARTDGGDVVLEVSDDGIGIDPADLERVFDRFWRADPSRSRTAGGSGLGLAIGRRIVRAHGGDITATSGPGRGSTFTVRIPR